ncbi:MAG: putative metal-binding motif-containing protein [Sandaracinus sp.]
MVRSAVPWLGLGMLGMAGCTPTPPLSDDAGAALDAPALDAPVLDASSDARARGDGSCDEDGDGHAALACGGDDCDDADPLRYPTAAETCDAAGHDEDCDSSTLGARDADGDGAVDVACCNGAVCGTDCDDADVAVRPGASEVCNAFDDDCDAAVDEGVLVIVYRDADGDGFGDVSETMDACSPPAGYVFDATDCDDAHALVHVGALPPCGCGADHPADSDGDGHVEIACGGDDCRDDLPLIFGGAAGACACGTLGAVRQPYDADADSFVTVSCGGDDCADDAGLVHPGASAGCACTAARPYDADGDGVSSLACGGPDCDDARAAVRPGATEICNAIDDDCDAHVDEAPPLACSPSVGGATCTTACGATGRRVCDAATCTETTACGEPTFLWLGADPALLHDSGAAADTDWCSEIEGTRVVYGPGTRLVAAGPHVARFSMDGTLLGMVRVQVFDATAMSTLAELSTPCIATGSGCDQTLSFVAPAGCHAIELRVYLDTGSGFPGFPLCVHSVSISPT